ncbi:MAG: InlB B-repeat-containing protein, partial [Clostridia bacterium]|nr:InlB B-repeat-containing protein [Clostridia bacterium]
YCKNCDYSTKVDIKANGHRLEQVEAKAPTCTEIGWNAYDYCTKCDYTTKVELKANGHVIEQVKAKAPTCTEVGWDAHEYCANCDYTTKVEIKANGHTEGDWKIDIVPNCLSGGHMHKECDICHLVLKEEDTNALGHDIKTAIAKAPTCTEVGWNTYDYCARCNYTTKVELPATGHSFKKDWVNDSICHWHEADCGHDVTTEPVLHDYDDNWKCTICHYQDTAIHGTELRARTFSVDGTNLYTKVSNSTTTFSFINEIRVAKDASFAVYRDIQGSSEIVTKTTALEIGDNVVYLLVRNGNDIGFYTATIRRRPIYNVTFDTTGGSAVANQQIEEDSFATEPTTTRKGYTFDTWDYDFASPIVGDTAITASWDINYYNIAYEMSDTGFAYRALNNSFNPTTYTVEDSITFANPTCTGYTFNGWDTTKIAKGTVGDITVTAKPWSIVSYKITYNNNLCLSSPSDAGD